ncbi:MAG: galactokinase [Nitrospinaceae bacterium]|nr:galactokinase [Nitrospinaceae bacterium]
MIITRSPLRVSLGGGGTDLPSYYREHGGFLIAGAINKYVYITIHKTFVEDLIIKYSKLERVSSVEELSHPIIRESMKLVGLKGNRLEISSLADIPSGTGLGSSGSFTTALLKALHTYKKNIIDSEELAEEACHVEIDLLQEPIGKQDQYIAAFGGIICCDFKPNGKVQVSPLKISNETLYNLEDNLVLFFTGYSRSASSILVDQKKKSEENDKKMLQNLHYIKDLGHRSRAVLENGDLDEFGKIMNEHWQYKRDRSDSITNPKIDEWYQLALGNGAIGGKLIGAGGGGFLMFYAEDKIKLRHTMIEAGLEEVRFGFDFEGTKVVIC